MNKRAVTNLRICAADGCEHRIHSGLVMCTRHWDMVSKPVRDEIWSLHNPSREPSPACNIAIAKAVKEVAGKALPL